MHVEVIRFTVTLLATALGYRFGLGSEILDPELAQLAPPCPPDSVSNALGTHESTSGSTS